MSTAIGRSIAAAIVEDCNLETWSQPCEFQRKYVPREELETTADIVVQVVYAGQRTIPDSRAAWRHEYDIDIGVMKKLEQDGNDESDALTDFLDDVIDYWKTNTPGTTGARMIGAEWLNPYVPDHMTRLKQFTGVARLTFRLVRTNS